MSAISCPSSSGGSAYRRLLDPRTVSTLLPCISVLVRSKGAPQFLQNFDPGSTSTRHREQSLGAEMGRSSGAPASLWGLGSLYGMGVRSGAETTGLPFMLLSASPIFLPS